MIPNKFLCYKTEAGFLEELGKGLIQDSSVVMVMEGPFIYTHGTRFHCSVTTDTIEFLELMLSSSINDVTKRLDENERTIAGVLSDIKENTLINGQSILGETITITKSDIGLGNVNNTSDASKPISTATQTALDKKVDKTITVNGHALSANVTVSKSDLGLGNVDNTSDVNKPVSTATQTALDGKVDKTTTISGHALTSNVVLDVADVGLEDIDKWVAGGVSDVKSDLDNSNLVIAMALNDLRDKIDNLQKQINELLS